MRLFAALSESDLQRLARLCLLKEYTPGDLILQEGSTGLGLFIITAGRVEVFKTRDGEPIPLAVLGEGDVLGEIALLDDQPRSASAVALEPTECLLLSRSRFRNLLETRPQIAWPIVPALAGRVRDLQEQLLETKPPDPASEAARGSDRSKDTAAVATAVPTIEINAEASRSALRAAQSPRRLESLPTPHALVQAGLDSLDEPFRLIEVFLHSLEEETGLWRGRHPGEIGRRLPGGLVKATRASWSAGLSLPTRLIDRYRSRLTVANGDLSPGEGS